MQGMLSMNTWIDDARGCFNELCSHKTKTTIAMDRYSNTQAKKRISRRIRKGMRKGRKER